MVLAHNMLKPRLTAGGTTAWRTAFFNHRVSNMRQSRPDEAMSDSPLKMKLAFYSWLGLLLITLGTFTAGFLGHFVTLIAAPWLSLGTQAAIHAAIPVLLTAVKFVTVPLLLVLVPSHAAIRLFDRGQTGAKRGSASSNRFSRFHGLLLRRAFCKQPYFYVARE
jgi:hypothetical protein